MELTRENIDQIVFGACKIEQTDAGYTFDRMTDRQKAVWAEANPYFPEPHFDGYFFRNCATDANISLEFVTDSPKVTIEIGEMTPGNGAKDGQSLEVFVNAGRGRIVEQPGQYVLRLRKESRVQILLPYYGHIVLKGIALEDGSSWRPVSHTARWLCHGDSITHGCVASRPSKTYVSRVAQKYQVEVRNQANAGYVHDMRIPERIPGWEPDVVTSAYGCNDFGRKSEDAQREDMLAYCQVLKKCFPNSRIYVISPVWSAGRDEKKDLAEKADRMYRMFETIAAQTGLSLIDGRKLIPHSRAYYQKDGTHPNDAGFAYYAARLGKLLFG